MMCKILQPLPDVLLSAAKNAEVYSEVTVPNYVGHCGNDDTQEANSQECRKHYRWQDLKNPKL